MAELPRLPRETRKLVTRDCPGPPPCPHCGGDMDGAALTLGELAEALGDGCVVNDRSGVMDGHKVEEGLRCACPSCGRESMMAIDERAVGLLHMRLSPFWTEADDRYLSERVSERAALPG